jgi:integrase
MKLPRGLRLHNGYLELRLKHEGRSIFEHFGRITPDTLQAAKIRLLELRKQLALGRYEWEAPVYRMPFEEAADVYTRLYGPQFKSERSLKTCECIVGSLKRAWTGRYIDSITPMDVLAYRKQYSPSTANRHHAVITSLFNRLEEWNDLGNVFQRPVKLPRKNPGSQVSKASESAFVRNRVLTPEEWTQFTRHCTPRVLEICNMALKGTLRKKDIESLSRKSLHETEVSGIQAKTGRRFAVSVPESSREALQTRGRFDFTNFRKEFDAARNSAVKEGVPYFTFRDLRRSGATWMRRQGVRLEVIQDVLGHADISMTRRYLHVTSQDKREAVQLLESIFKSGGKSGGKRVFEGVRKRSI